MEMTIIRVIHQIQEDLNELKGCYSILVRSDVYCGSLLEAINSLESSLLFLKAHPKTQEEIGEVKNS